MKKVKKFRFKKPEIFGLNPQVAYYVIETEKGYSMKVHKYCWIGFPKHIVEKNPDTFELITA